MYKNPRKCPDCHNNIQSASNFSAPQVVEHRIGAPDVPTTGTQCSLCHNNSLTAITEADGFGLSSGGNAQNATASHYLKDANANLMTTGSTATTVPGVISQTPAMHHGAHPLTRILTSVVFIMAN